MAVRQAQVFVDIAFEANNEGDVVSAMQKIENAYRRAVVELSPEMGAITKVALKKEFELNNNNLPY